MADQVPRCFQNVLIMFQIEVGSDDGNLRSIQTLILTLELFPEAIFINLMSSEFDPRSRQT